MEILPEGIQNNVNLRVIMYFENMVDGNIILKKNYMGKISVIKIF